MSMVSSVPFHLKYDFPKGGPVHRRGWLSLLIQDMAGCLGRQAALLIY